MGCVQSAVCFVLCTVYKDRRCFNLYTWHLCVIVLQFTPVMYENICWGPRKNDRRGSPDFTLRTSVSSGICLAFDVVILDF